MTPEETRSLTRGTQLQFGQNPTVWTYFGFSERQHALMVTRPNGVFVKAWALPIEMIKNVQIIKESAAYGKQTHDPVQA